MRLKAALLFCVLTGLARAQFYAPDTEYHDIAQRTFPVEAARVLAWVRNQAAPAKPIDGVDFKFETTAERESVWTLTWSAAGQVVREKTVRYPESLLVEGPRFYREVFAQLLGEDWKPASAPPDNAASAFWQGTTLAGVSRLEAVRAADQFLKEKKTIETPADAARLAGILAQGALPMLGTQLTIDSLFLSRSAAWLCLAETMRREPLASAWVPIEFLAGREKAAAARWVALPAKAAEKLSAAERFWNLVLRKSEVSEFFVFGTKRENRSYAMASLAFISRTDDCWMDNAPLLARSITGDLHPRFYDYLPLFSERGGIAGGHLGTPGSALFLQAWEKGIQDFSGDDEGSGCRDLLAKAAAARSADENVPQAVRRLGPVLNLGTEDKRGALLPVAHLTTRDLLGFGWEEAAVQVGSLHRFLAKGLGVPEKAKEIGIAARESLKGIRLLVDDDTLPKSEELSNRYRLEFVGIYRVQEALAQGWPTRKGPTPDYFFRRSWLWKTGGTPAFFACAKQGWKPDDAAAGLARLVQEGGALSTSGLFSENQWIWNSLHRSGVRDQLVSDIPWALEPQKQKAWEEFGAGNLFGYAQALEKLNWKYGVAFNEDMILRLYVQANALDCARRFYDQITPYVADAVTFSGRAGPMRFSFASWEGDEAGMQRVLKDCNTYSAADLTMRINFALYRGDLPEAEKVIDAYRERYAGQAAELDQIKAYLPLIPALKDPKHAEHERALDTFPKIQSWAATQWILARNAKLTTEETIRFLGGDAPMESNVASIAYLKKDKEAFEKAFQKDRYDAPPRIGALRALMRNELLGIQPPAEQPDLKPADAKPLFKLVEQALKKAEEENASSLETDLAKLTTADEFWAAIEKLRERPSGRPSSPEEGLLQERKWRSAQRDAAVAFQKRFPQEARRHEAKMLEIEARDQLVRMGDRSARPPARAEVDAVLAAPDASENVRIDAEFFQLLLDASQVDLSSPHTLPPYHQRLSDFATQHPQHPRALDTARMQIQLLTIVETPGADNLLKKLAAHPDARIAEQASALLVQREHLASLKKKPLELKFTASDGKLFDFASLRGKVVLIDFWASWCGPCMADAPKVAALYRELHDQGFEIVGINLDEDKAAMEAAVKRVGMPWVQAFDGKGWGSDLVKRFGVRAIPSTWLFDRSGKLSEMGLRGEELEARIQRLLEKQ